MNKKKLTFLRAPLMAAIILLLAFTLAHAGPGAVPNAPLYSNGRPTYYANSPAGLTPIMNSATGVTTSTNSGTALRKFVDSLAGLGLPACTPGIGVAPNITGGTCGQNNLGNYIPIATADTGTFLGSDYYVIGMADYTQKFHRDLIGPSKLRGYHEIIGGVPQSNHYLGPVILATKNTPVRVLFKNTLGPSNTTGKLFIPVDTTVMGAGNGPDGSPYAENRATLHLHGGHTPWISDGTPHQWITPALDPTTLNKGDSFQNVPDMVGAGKPIVTPDPTDGLATFFWTNQQSGRFMFYHDHAYGLTRLNVYAGEAAGYLIVDPQESVMMGAGTLPNICDPGVNGGLCAYIYGIPLVIQDKTFVPANVGGIGSLPATGGQDTLWDMATWGGEGNLWFPHVYEPAQDLDESSGLSPSGRWDYGPYVWPPSPVTNPTLPTVSLTPEAFMDTPIVNGTAYPYLPVERKAYRFRILSAGNDRSFNLQLYYGVNAAGAACAPGAYSTCTEVKMVPAIATDGFPATWPTDNRDGGVPDPATAGPQMILIGNESGFLPAPVVLPNQPITFDGVGNVAEKTLLLMPAERADVIIDFTAVPLGSTIILYNDAPAALPGGDSRYDYYTGNPDQTESGGAPSTLAGFGPNTRTIMQFRVTNAANTAPVVTATNLAGLSAATPAVGALATAYAASQPAHIVPAAQYAQLTDTSMTIGGEVIPFRGKSVNEGFDPTYGRINAMLGTQDPSGLTPPVPLEYIVPATEIVRNDQVQLWKVTHNGVDSHPIHFHLTDVQVVNRVGWDGSIRPPDPSEMGWKETVRMNPMEEVIIAMRPTEPQLPFPIPNSIRRLDVTQPVSATNPLTNFGHEYVWHCHILGHEEFDLMRPLVLNTDQLLYVANAGAGIWQWDMGTWTQLITTDPTNMTASGTLLYATFAGAGLQKWDGSTWTPLHPVAPTSMVASGSILYATFAGAGLQKWNGSAWTQLHPVAPTSMVASGSYLYAIFAGAGLHRWNGSAWTQLNATAPTDMVASGSYLYATFAGAGLHRWDGSGWTQLHPVAPASMSATDFYLYATFAGAGLHRWDGSGWTLVHPVAPSIIAASGSILYADFAGSGIYKWENNAWTTLTPTDPALMMAGF